MSQSTVLITGANRGIGLKFAEEYLKLGWHVIATCRNPSHASKLNQLATDFASIEIYPLEVSNSDQIHELADALKNKPIDVLINNAGIHRSCTLGSIDKQAWLESFAINSIAPYELTIHLLDNILQGSLKKVISITSKMGSIDDNTSGGSYIYRSSKTALNSIMRSLEHDLDHHGIATLTLHPGWVKTDMGGMGAWINVDESVAGMIKQIEKLNLSNAGRYVDYAGKKINW
jgi:NAD(P)-dependent dehydrogenase (short-subunit alcohol dehydrogenase family)